ncbi:MAG: CBS domain-containing protein [Campylobacteraceae bacterium]|nr:CBS domain-containing protein [Campylobacteraceae bacterium]
MNKLSNITLTTNSTMREALKIIDAGDVKFAIVVDIQDILLGTLSDGDIRRAILDGKGLEDTIEDVYFKTPTVVKVDSTKEEIINLCTSKKIYQIPVVDERGELFPLKYLMNY